MLDSVLLIYFTPSLRGGFLLLITTAGNTAAAHFTFTFMKNGGERVVSACWLISQRYCSGLRLLISHVFLAFCSDKLTSNSSEQSINFHCFSLVDLVGVIVLWCLRACFHSRSVMRCANCFWRGRIMGMFAEEVEWRSERDVDGVCFTVTFSSPPVGGGTISCILTFFFNWAFSPSLRKYSPLKYKYHWCRLLMPIRNFPKQWSQ